MWRAPALVLLASVLSCRSPESLAPGQPLQAGSLLRDVRGTRRSLGEFKDARAIVLAFLGTDCPLSNLYVPRLAELEARHRDRKVRFIAVYPNDGEWLDAVAVHADEWNIGFLVLKDVGHRLADAIGVERTPEVAVLDGGLTLRYRGRIDDQYGTASRKDRPAREDLVQALDDLLAGQPVRTAATEADGCLIKRRGAERPSTDVTYARDVAPIFQRRCQSCHRAGQAAPFPLEEYADAADRAAMIREVVVQRRMPPWHADARFGKFSNDRSLTAREIATIAAWADLGAPRGNPADDPKPVAWPEGWGIGTPDVVLTLPREVDVPAEGVMDYKYFTAPTGFTEDTWIVGAEVRPGDRRVVHHVLVYARMPGRELYEMDGTSAAIAGWAPGDMPFVHPPGTAARIPKGAELVWEVHYTPNGKATKDRTSLALIFAKEPPEREVRTNIFAKMTIKVPPATPHHREESSLTLREDARLLSLMPHMHRRGKSWRYELVHPDGRTETILNVARWDFNWQSVYRFDEPLRLAKGTQIRAVAHWDNSDNNPLNPDPSKSVRWGLQTFNEMMNGWVSYVPEKPTKP